MKVMCIDIGTNSTLHLIADVNISEVTVVERGIAGNSLGADIGSDGIIGDALLEKNRTILQTLVHKSRELGCEYIFAVGTHALRRASNRDEFITMAQQTGVPLKIISDVAEAEYAWKGVFGIDGPDRLTALLDLGGGSCELILGAGSDPEWSDSIPVGAVMLSRDHFLHDPPLKDEVIAAEEVIKQSFSRWSRLSSRKFNLIGIAGTVTALAAVRHNVITYEPGVLEGLVLSPDDIAQAQSRLLSLDRSERKAIPGMPVARAESIHAGVLILNSVLDIIGRRDITVSEKGVLFGMAISLAKIRGQLT